MPFPFRRTDPRRIELDEMRRQIEELQSELDVLDTAGTDEEAASQPPVTASGADSADIYQSVARLRDTMVRREARTKRQQLNELVQREAALAQALHMGPAKPRTRPTTPPARVPSTNGSTPASATRTDLARPIVNRGPARVAVGRASAAKTQPPRRELKFRRASVNLFNLALSIVALIVVVLIGLVLSGLLEMESTTAYGPLAGLARLVQGGIVGAVHSQGF